MPEVFLPFTLGWISPLSLPLTPSTADYLFDPCQVALQPFNEHRLSPALVDAEQIARGTKLVDRILQHMK